MEQKYAERMQELKELFLKYVSVYQANGNWKQKKLDEQEIRKHLYQTVSKWCFERGVIASVRMNGDISSGSIIGYTLKPRIGFNILSVYNSLGALKNVGWMNKVSVHGDGKLLHKVRTDASMLEPFATNFKNFALELNKEMKSW